MSRFPLTLDDDLRARVQAQADIDKRSLNAQISVMLAEAASEREKGAVDTLARKTFA